MKPRLRAARATDTDVLTALVLRSKASHGYDADFMNACRNELAVTERRLGVGRWWVAEGEQSLGCAQLLIERDRGLVNAFFVDPPAQGCGVGRLLWDALEGTARHLGIARLELDADPGAVGFYEHLGLVCTGRSRSGSIPGRWIPRMSKLLTAPPPRR